VHFPWKITTELVEEPGFTGFAQLNKKATGGNPGWYLECTILGTKVDDECTFTEDAAELLNLPGGGIEPMLSEAFKLLVEDKNGTCTVSKEETGIVEGSVVTTVAEGGTLTASSTG
jgi:hypothetical protein